MEQRVKQRLVGAVVLVALAVIFIPMLLTGPVEREPTDVPIEIPPKPMVSAPGVAATDEEVAALSSPMTASRPIETPSQPAGVPADVEEAAPLVAPDEPADKASSRTPSELASWTVQVGSFGSESNAMGLRDRLRQKGYPAYVDSIKGNTKVFYRVRVGPMIQRSEAELAQARLSKDEQLKSLVVPHP